MSAHSTGRTELRSPIRPLFATTPALCIPLRSAANTLLNALENLILIDERGQAREQPKGDGEKAEPLGGRRRASDRLTPTPLEDQMDVDDTFEAAIHREPDIGEPSPLKRKRDASSFPLPDPKSLRISATLSSRLQRSLRVAEQSDEASATSDGHDLPDSYQGAAPHVAHPRPGRRASRLSRNDSHNSLPDLHREISLSTIASPISPIFGLSRGSSIAENLDVMSISSWIECQAHRNGTTVENMQNIWNEKRRELEYNLNLLANGVPSDSYQDLKVMIEKIMEAAKWLSAGNMDELGELVPSWKLMEKSIENVVQYIKVVEDMKTTISTPFHLSGQLDADLKLMRECLEQKKEAWGDSLKGDGKAWAILGFPVEELRPLLSAAASWIYGLPWGYFVQLDSELNKLQESTPFQETNMSTQNLMEHVFEGILFARDCADLVHKPFQSRALHGAYTLTTLFTSFTLSLFEQVMQRASHKPRSVEVRVIQLYSNLVKLLEALRFMRGHFDDGTETKRESAQETRPKSHPQRDRVEAQFNQEPPMTPDSPQVADHASYFPITAEDQAPGQMEALDNLARVVVEAGLQLCEYVAARGAKQDGNTPQNNKSMLLTALAVRYVDAAVKLAGLKAEEQALLRKLPQDLIL